MGLLDSDGTPFHPRLERALTQLAARPRREFPALQDEVTVTEVIEQAGRRISRREQRAGAVEKLHGYAWVVICSVANLTPSVRLYPSSAEDSGLGGELSEAGGRNL